MSPPAIDREIEKVLALRHHDPFAVLGKHATSRGELVRTFLPEAVNVAIAEGNLALARVTDSGLFEWRGPRGKVPARYRLRWRDRSGVEHCRHDPYAFPPQIADFDLHLFSEGRHRHAYRHLGANPRTVEDVAGVLFATWAPNAERVSVVGDFNRWDGRMHPLRVRGASGVWELFVPGVPPGTRYKFEIRNRRSGSVFIRSDPYGRHFERRPANAPMVVSATSFPWSDGEWLERRRGLDWQHAPFSIYEVHLGSWRRDADGAFIGYRDLAEQLVDHVADLGFTHLELLPVTEHPLDASWGYQPMGFFAPTSRHGDPDDFRFFVDRCHARGLGVLLDWVPGHFPSDSEGLASFDGTSLYEHADPHRGRHPDWGTLIFDYGRNEVRSFLISSAVFWLEEFHLDGLRVDAVASMLYLDYSRRLGEWTPNVHGGRENLEAMAFLREMNGAVLGEFPGTVVIAEESTSWPQVTRPPWVGGLGFSMKWDMGWMHDTLSYLGEDPIHRKYHHDLLTFRMLYVHSENFVLPLSHDEVVHGKRPLIGKMPGDEWQRFANLRLLYTYLFTHVGKKLLFMGAELAQTREWDHDAELEWVLLERPLHRGVRDLVRDLNHLYRGRAALYRHDFEPHAGFEWIDCHDVSQSMLSYLRRDGDAVLVVCLNFTPVPRHGYRLGVPAPGRYREIFNSDSAHYGGGNVGNLGELTAEDRPWMGRPYSVVLTAPPLAGIVLEPLDGSRP